MENDDINSLSNHLQTMDLSTYDVFFRNAVPAPVNLTDPKDIEIAMLKQQVSALQIQMNEMRKTIEMINKERSYLINEISNLMK